MRKYKRGSIERESVGTRLHALIAKGDHTYILADSIQEAG